MPNIPAPDVTVLVRDTLLKVPATEQGNVGSAASAVAVALARAGWLRPPHSKDPTLPEVTETERMGWDIAQRVTGERDQLAAEVAPLRAVADAAAKVDEILHQEDQIWSNAEAAEALGQSLLCLTSVPLVACTTSGDTPTPGATDEQRAGGGCDPRMGSRTQTQRAAPHLLGRVPHRMDG